MNFRYSKKFNHRFFLVLSISVFIISLFFSSVIIAQGTGKLEVDGRCITPKGGLYGATIAVYKNGSTKVVEEKSDVRGNFSFELPFGNDYIINFSASGYINMFLEVSAKNVDFNDKTVYEPIVQFYTKAEGGEDMVEKFKDPLAKVFWNGRKKKFNDDEEYQKKFIGNVMAQERMDKLAVEKEKARIAQMRKERDEHDKSILAQQKAAKEGKESAAKEAELARKQQEEKLLAENLKRDKELAEQLEKEHDALAKKLQDSMKAYEAKMRKEAENKALAESKEKENKTEATLTDTVAVNKPVTDNEIIPVEVTKAVIKQFDKDLERKVELNEIDKIEKEKANTALIEAERRVKAENSLYYALAYANRAELLANQKSLPEYKDYVANENPKVTTNESDGYFKYVRTTVVYKKNQTYTYRKERTILGSVHCYKNDNEIDETAYNKEIQYYLPFTNRKQ